MPFVAFTSIPPFSDDISRFLAPTFLANLLLNNRRVLLILGREMGLELEEADVNLVPVLDVSNSKMGENRGWRM